MTGGDLESRLARVEQGMIDLDKRVTNLTPLVAAVAVLSEKMDGTREDVAQYAAQAARDRKEAADREENRRKDKAATRQWAIGILVTVLLGLLAAAVVLIAQGH